MYCRQIFLTFVLRLRTKELRNLEFEMIEMNLAVLSSLAPRLPEPLWFFTWYDFPGSESSVKIETFSQKLAISCKVLKILLAGLSELAHFVLFCFEGGLIFNFYPRNVEICQKSIVLAQFFDGKLIFTLNNRIFQIYEKYMLKKLNFWG